jgi:maltose alpha-D-glucosyltransferase/alpha-amylase
VIMDGEYGAKSVNANLQQRDPNSLSSWVRRLVDVRQSCPEIGWGECELVRADNEAVFVQRVSWSGQSAILLHNLDDKLCKVAIDLNDDEAGHLTDLFGNRVYPSETGARRVIELDPYGYRWFRVQSQRQNP